MNDTGSGIAGDVYMAAMSGAMAYELWQGHNDLAGKMTPPERADWEPKTGRRVFIRVLWVAVTFAAVMLTSGQLELWTWTISLALAIYVHLRWKGRFNRSRAREWDSYLRTQGTSLDEVRAYTEAVQRQQAREYVAQQRQQLAQMREFIIQSGNSSQL